MPVFNARNATLEFHASQAVHSRPWEVWPRFAIVPGRYQPRQYRGWWITPPRKVNGRGTPQELLWTARRGGPEDHRKEQLFARTALELRQAVEERIEATAQERKRKREERERQQLEKKRQQAAAAARAAATPDPRVAYEQQQAARRLGVIEALGRGVLVPAAMQVETGVEGTRVCVELVSYGRVEPELLSRIAGR